MRSRDDILKAYDAVGDDHPLYRISPNAANVLSLEVLLDIRELLQWQCDALRVGLGQTGSAVGMIPTRIADDLADQMPRVDVG